MKAYAPKREAGDEGPKIGKRMIEVLSFMDKLHGQP